MSWTGEAGSPDRLAADLISVAVEPQVEPGARADLDQVHWFCHVMGDHAQAQPESEGPLHLIGLDQPGTDRLGQFRPERLAE